MLADSVLLNLLYIFNKMPVWIIQAQPKETILLQCFFNATSMLLKPTKFSVISLCVIEVFKLGLYIIVWTYVARCNSLSVTLKAL